MLFEGVGSVVDFAQPVSQMIHLFPQLSCKVTARSSVASLASVEQHGQYRSISRLCQFPARSLSLPSTFCNSSQRLGPRSLQKLFFPVVFPRNASWRARGAKRDLLFCTGTQPTQPSDPVGGCTHPLFFPSALSAGFLPLISIDLL